MCGCSHTHTHTQTQEELAIACDVCGKTYTSKQGLIYHMKSQHTQPYTDHTPQDNNQEVFVYTCIYLRGR